MKKLVLVGVALFAVSACAETVSETEGTFTFQGKTYRSVEREFQSPSGPYSRRYIYIGASRISCSATDDADCRGAISYGEFDGFGL